MRSSAVVLFLCNLLSSPENPPPLLFLSSSENPPPQKIGVYQRFASFLMIEMLEKMEKFESEVVVPCVCFERNNYHTG